MSDPREPGRRSARRFAYALWIACVLGVCTAGGAGNPAGAGSGGASAGSPSSGSPSSGSPEAGPRSRAARRSEPGAGGATTTRRFDTSAFSLPAANLSPTRRLSFFAGNSFFTQPWVAAPSSTSARDGLGPLFNTNTCQSCHLKDGRGRPPEGDERMISMLVRLSVPADATQVLGRDGSVPERVYGDQLQTRALGDVPAEAEPSLTWRQTTGTFDDGTAYTLLEPRLVLRRLGYGPIRADARFSLRVAPALVGLGLLENVPETSIRMRADPADADGDGISGRVSRVWDRTQGRRVVGRFGWKAGQPSVEQQVAAAFAGDLGIRSQLYPESLCTEAQLRCRELERRAEVELTSEVLELVTFYVKGLGVPDRRQRHVTAVQSGEQLFRESGCIGCHVEQLETTVDPDFPELSQQTIRPYTDLLLHDMGEGLADGRAEFEASGREWRTPPLWGIGLVEVVSRHTRFLHDGRARNLQEAILWHGGEAAASRDAYRGLSRTQRDQLLFFLRSL